MIGKKILLSLLVFISTVWLNPVLLAKIYKYTDNNGTNHFQDYPPEISNPESPVEVLETYDINNSQTPGSEIKKKRIPSSDHSIPSPGQFKNYLIYHDKKYTFLGKSRGTDKQSFDLSIAKDGLRWIKIYKEKAYEHFVTWEAIEDWRLCCGGISFTYFKNKALKLSNPKSRIAFHFDIPYGDKQIELAHIFMGMIPERQKK